MSMQMKQHDLEPALQIVVEDAAGVANLNLVTGWRIIGKIRGQVVVNGAPTTAVVDPLVPSKATLTRAWVSGDTALTGDMRIEVEATWPTGRPQTFPPMGYEAVTINPDLG